MHFLENRFVHTSDPIVYDFHRIAVMCLCYVDRMAAMGMWFNRMAVRSIGYNSGKCCHIVGLGCRMMVVHFLEFLDHVVDVCVQAAQRQMVYCTDHVCVPLDCICYNIRMFVNYLCPLLIIDATHLKGQYKGTNLVAVGMDENNQIVPISFGLCKGETCPCWSCWMSVLKECIGDSPNLLFISDRHATIALVVHNEFLLAFHAICCHHLMMNLSLKRKKTSGLFWKICKAYTPEEFSTKISNLHDVQPDAYHKLCEAHPERWLRAHCPLVRYNNMTSNSVESVNACTVLYRKLPVLKLAETYHAMV
ncbi:transposase, MuDR, MULE transposase domain protein [Tanacetum coccineum]